MSRRIGRGPMALLVLIAASLAPLLAGESGAGAAADGSSSPCNNGQSVNFGLESTIAFTSTRDKTAGETVPNAAEIYLMGMTAAGEPDPADTIRLTDNTSGDGFASLSPDGTKIVFDSTRLSGQFNVSDLFLMNADGSDQTFLTRGSSATWSPDCKQIAFHASASGHGYPVRTDPGSPMSDSDIFVANVDDLLSGHAQPTDITNSDGVIEDDADWSPDGQHIVYTAHNLGDDIPNGTGFTSNSAEIYVINADGTGRVQLTDNHEQEATPAWSPDGTRIAYECRIGGGTSDLEICVMNADGSDVQQLTDNSVPDIAPVWSRDGLHLLFSRPVPGQGMQLFTMNSSLTDGTPPPATQLTSPPGINLNAQWGELRVHHNP